MPHQFGNFVTLGFRLQPGKERELRTVRTIGRLDDLSELQDLLFDTIVVTFNHLVHILINSLYNYLASKGKLSLDHNTPTSTLMI